MVYLLARTELTLIELLVGDSDGSKTPVNCLSQRIEECPMQTCVTVTRAFRAQFLNLMCRPNLIYTKPLNRITEHEAK
jgi:hypothetical protein